MDESVIEECEQSEALQIKQNFLASAIADISSYIHLVDTKVSLLMTAVVALLVGVLTCSDFIESVLSGIVPCSWHGLLLVVLSIVFIGSVVGLFVFGILTIRVR